MKKELYFVDDDQHQRLRMRVLFKESLTGYTIRLFDSGQALYLHLIAISSEGYKGPLPGLIMLDLNMPGIDGMTVLKLIRTKVNQQHIHWNIVPVVLFTGFVTDLQLLECYQAGANSVLIKPEGEEQWGQLMEVNCSYWLTFNQVKMYTREP